MVVENVEIENPEINPTIIISVRPTKRDSCRCGICGKKCSGYDRGNGKRRWRALDIGNSSKVYLESDSPRVWCKMSESALHISVWHDRMQIQADSDGFSLPFDPSERVIRRESHTMGRKPVSDTIHAKGFDIRIYTFDFQNEFISLTDIAKYKSDDPNATICNWMRSRETLEFLGLWESLHNPDFNPLEFEGFRSQAGLHAFTMSPTKWITGVSAIGIVTKAGRYGGTFAHADIALEFASWISAEFKLYIVKDYQRIKRDENSRLSLGWNLNREIAKLN